MASARRLVLEWAEQGVLPAEHVETALTVAGVRPTPAQWRRFVSALLLWLGALLFAAGVIFFFAYNWDALGRFTKFALVEGALVAAVAAGVLAGPDSTAGKALLLLAALLTGATLALIGQTYQTGADTYELFAWWALLILPWTLVSREPVFWLLEIVLANLAVAMYFQAFRGFGPFPGGNTQTWAIAILNAGVLVCWELAASVGPLWTRARWAIRIVAALGGISVTVLAVMGILDHQHIDALSLSAYVVWIAGAYFYYRHRVRDLFVLAGGVLSVVVTVACLMGKVMVQGRDVAGGLLMIGLVVIGLSALGAWWLRELAADE